MSYQRNKRIKMKNNVREKKKNNENYFQDKINMMHI